MPYRKGDKTKDGSFPKPIDHDRFFRAVELYELGKFRGGIATITEAAEYVGVSVPTMRKWMKVWYGGGDFPKGLFINVPEGSRYYGEKV